VRRIRRADAAQAERAAQPTISNGTTADPTEARRKLLDSGFALDGDWVLWGDATPAQHRQRAEALRKLAAGTLATARRHEEAAELIEAAGATCLREVEE
jgi:hypothetical protein